MITRPSHTVSGERLMLRYTWNNTAGFGPYKYHIAKVSTDTRPHPVNITAMDFDCFLQCDTDLRFVLLTEEWYFYNIIIRLLKL